MEVVPFALEREFEKHSDITPDDVTRLRDWLRTQPHLPEQYITDLDLILAYYCCKKSSELTKQVLDLHFTLRTLFTTYYKDRCFNDKTEQVLDSILLAALKPPSEKGYRTIYARLLDADPKNFCFAESIRTFMMMFDLWQLEEGSWPGFVIVIDMDKAVVGHLSRVDVTTIRQVLYFLQEAMLVKLRTVHFMNAPAWVDKVMLLLKPFIKKELHSMLHIHQVGADTIYKFVPKESFPRENGGAFKSYDEIRDELKERLKNNTNYFKEENKKRVEESLRPAGERSRAEALFGTQGSFKKLDFD